MIRINQVLCGLLILLLDVTMLSAFLMPNPSTVQHSLLLAKGFDKNDASAKKVPSEGSQKRQAQSVKYDEIAATGGQEYSIFIRQFGSDDSSWLPCGAIAVPRNAQVTNAIKANLDGLKSSIVRSYPKLRGNEDEFEFGFNLKIYPDDPIEVANLGAPLPSQGLSFGNWVSTLLSPVDTSGVAPPPIPDEPTTGKN